MSPLFIILSVLLIATCITLVSVILMQKKRASGLSGALSGSGGAGAGGSSTYWDKNKGRSLEGQLELYTKIAAALFFVLTFLFAFIR